MTSGANQRCPYRDGPYCTHCSGHDHLCDAADRLYRNCQPCKGQGRSIDCGPFVRHLKVKSCGFCGGTGRRTGGLTMSYFLRYQWRFRLLAPLVSPEWRKYMMRPGDLMVDAEIKRLRRCGDRVAARELAREHFGREEARP